MENDDEQLKEFGKICIGTDEQLKRARDYILSLPPLSDEDIAKIEKQASEWESPSPLNVLKLIALMRASKKRQ